MWVQKHQIQRRAIASLLLVLSGCSINVQHSGKSFSCETTADCPGTLSCVTEVCVSASTPEDAAGMGNLILDGGTEDSGAVDAEVVDSDVADALVQDAEVDGVIVQSIEKVLESSDDDAEEVLSTGALIVFDSVFDMATPPAGTTQLLGLRFRGLAIPVGATVVSARIEFSAAATSAGDATLQVSMEDRANPVAFTVNANDISARPQLGPPISWSAPPWSLGEVALSTPNLAILVQQTVNGAGWQSGNSVVFLLQGTGLRQAYTFEGAQEQASSAPRLVVEYY